MAKRFRVFEIDNMYGVSDDIANITLAWDTSKIIMDGLCKLLNEQDEKIVDLKCHNEDLVQDNMYLEDKVANQLWKMKKLKKEVLKLKYFISIHCADWECDACPLVNEDCVLQLEVE